MGVKNAIVRSVNISEEKGTVKIPVPQIRIDNNGVQDDAHAGNWHRQVSLLGVESFNKSEELHNRSFAFGDFAENITTEGVLLYKTAVLDRFVCGDLVLEVTQIGKKCHSGCAIALETGDCVMPKEGIFARVISGGVLKAGDVLEYQARIIKVMVITLSDRASSGVYEDKSGSLVKSTIEKFFEANRRTVQFDVLVIPDDKLLLETALQKAKEEEIDIVVTTGGTGIGPRDITPDVVKPLLDKEIPGIMEMIRLKYGSEKPNVLLSRSVAGVMGKTLVYVLPGSVRGVKEYLSEITPGLEHSLRMINGIDNH